MTEQAQKLLPMTTKPDKPVEVYGSANGWLNVRWDDGMEYYFVPNATFHKLDKKIKQQDIPNTWTHLGEYQMVEPA